MPTPWTHYRHYRSSWWADHTYEVIGLAKHSETDEIMVVYKPLYDNERFDEVQFAVRPLAMWDEMVEREGKMVRRFTEMVDRMMPFGFVFDSEGRVLLLHRIDRNTREPIKWWIELWETAEEAFIRELYEETGISIEEVSSFSFIDEFVSPIALHGKEIHLRRIIYEVKLLWSQPPIVINHIAEWWCDHDQYGRFTMSELEGLDIDFKEAFMEALQSIVNGYV